MWGRRKDRKIDAYNIDAPEGWYALPLDASDEDLREVAAQVGADDAARQVVAGMLPGLRDELGETDSIAGAFWVPDASTGVVCGALGVSFVLPDEGYDFTPERLREAYLSSRPEGVTIHSREAELISLPAGPSLRSAEIVSEDGSGDIEERIFFTVFPPGACEGLELGFVSAILALGERLGEESLMIARSLTIALA